MNATIARRAKVVVLIAGTVSELMGEDGKLTIDRVNLSKECRVRVDIDFPNEEFIPLTLTEEVSRMLRHKQITLGSIEDLNVAVMNARNGEEIYSVGLPKDAEDKMSFTKAELAKNKKSIVSVASKVKHDKLIVW